MIASDSHLLPRPRHVRRRSTAFHLNQSVRIQFEIAPADSPESRELSRWLHRLRREMGLNWRRGARNAAATIRFEHDAGRREQEYRLSIEPHTVAIRASEASGFRNGMASLRQLISAAGRDGAIQCMEIDDGPDFPVRGIMLDVSRGKVPSMATMRMLIDRFANWKLNQLQLYFEHAFAYRRHRRVWRGASPFTASQIRTLDGWCRRRGIELVPNQNSLGHMERWLRHEPYRRLAETSGPWRTPWGEIRSQPSTLCPSDPGSIRLMKSLYDELLPSFSSGLANVGCDEPFELGQGRSRARCRRIGLGRVFAEYLGRLHAALKNRGRRIMYWSDVVHQHPDSVKHLPHDGIALVWGYEADHPFKRQCREMARAGLAHYVCPGTSSWCSYSGRSRNSIGNLGAAAIAGRQSGAAGFLITDWGDGGHPQYLPVSYLGWVIGAALSWCVRTNSRLNPALETGRHAFGDPTGKAGALWFLCGRVHEASRVAMKNRTVLFSLMQTSLGELARQGSDKLVIRQGRQLRTLGRSGVLAMRRRITRLRKMARGFRFPGADGPLVGREFVQTLDVLEHACHRAEAALLIKGIAPKRIAVSPWAADLRRIIREHRSLWLARNRAGGLAESLAHFRRCLDEYDEYSRRTAR